MDPRETGSRRIPSMGNNGRSPARLFVKCMRLLLIKHCRLDQQGLLEEKKFKRKISHRSRRKRDHRRGNKCSHRERKHKYTHTQTQQTNTSHNNGRWREASSPPHLSPSAISHSYTRCKSVNHSLYLSLAIHSFIQPFVSLYNTFIVDHNFFQFSASRPLLLSSSISHRSSGTSSTAEQAFPQAVSLHLISCFIHQIFAFALLPCCSSATRSRVSFPRLIFLPESSLTG